MARRCLLAIFVLSHFLPRVANGVVISEIHYNPPVGDEALEFVEIANDLATPEDVSGYSFTNGIDFVIPPGTVLGAYGVLVVAANTEAVRTRYGIENVVGDFTGRLDAGGERITLSNHAGAVLQELRFRDRGKWPTGPDGTGHTLSLLSVYSDSAEPESWRQSLELGGTPGRPNFSSMDPQFEETVLVDRGAAWRYAKGTVPFSTPPAAWRAPAFDDSTWAQGPSGFGYADGDDATELTDMINNYVSVAARKRFVLTAEEIAEPGELYLAMDYDDGFYAYLNGEEAARSNCGTIGEEFPFDAIATGAREAGTEDLFVLPKRLLTAGENVLAVAGHNFSIGSSDFSLIPRVIRRRLIVGTDPSGSSLTFNELYRGAAPGQGWVEIHNSDAVPANISGYRLTDTASRSDPFVFPQGSVVPSRGFLVVDEAATSLLFSDLEVHLFLLAPDGKAVTASVFERSAPPGTVRGGYSEARWPDGGPLEWVTPNPTRGAPNTVPRTTDVVINEIHYNPPEERTGEFIELHNRGAAAVDVSGFRFTKGIDWTIEDGTVIPPGGYLVVAESPSLLLDHYGLAGVQGPWIGKLANDGENIRLDDRSGNLVNEVRYAEGGSWSRWADGGGESLELIDPNQDNSFASAWDSSDESAKTAWEELTFRVPNYVVSGQSELHIYLVEAGLVRVDDVSISRAGGANHISNPGFETSTSPWVIEGTHLRSRRITSDSHGGSACLEVNASGQGDTLVNRIEVETSPRMTAGAYDVSLWARWVHGASLMVVHGEYTAGTFGGRPSPATNLSGNSLSRGLRLTVPRNIGTPGAQNSVRANLIASSGSGNLGPVIDSVKHSPPSPGPGQPVRVSARVSDSNGLAAVQVHYRVGNGAGGFTAIPLLDDGGNGDGAAQDGIFAGEIPGLAGTTRVVFFVEASDSLGAEQRFPIDAPAVTCLYQVQGPVSPGLDTARMILDTARTSELQTRTLHSNDLLPGTFIFNNEEVYYNVGVRYRGSPWGRPGRSNYRVRFEDDHKFPRGRKALNLDNSGGGPNEGAAYFLGLRNAGPGSPAAVADYGYARTQLNGGSIGTHALMQPVDRGFLKTWYGDPATSVLLKVEGRRMFTDGGTLAGWDGGSFVHRGLDREHYRDYFIQGQRDSMDEWDSLIALTQVMDRTKTPNAAFDTRIDEVLDVEAFLRCLAPRILEADWDAFCIGNGHNGYLVLDPRDNRWELLPHDMDNTFGDPNATLFPAADPDVARLLSRPGPRRIYFRIIWDYINGGYWSAATAGPYFRALQTASGIGTAGILSYLTTSGNHKRTLIQASTTIAFKIVTNSGNEVTTEETSIDIVGDAPIQLSSIFYQRGGDEPKLLEPTWTTATRWQARFELPETQNDFEFLGFDSDGELTDSAQFSVRSTTQPSGPVVDSILPDHGPTSGSTVLTFVGSGFAPGMEVFIGGVECTGVQILAPDVAQARTPPAPFPLPADGKMDVEIVIPPSSPTILVKGFTYTVEGGFVRGDVTNDGSVNLSDAVASLFHLFRGAPILCADAADADDNGTVNLTDVMSVLQYLYSAGPPPAAPFPARGADATADSLACVE